MPPLVFDMPRGRSCQDGSRGTMRSGHYARIHSIQVTVRFREDQGHTPHVGTDRCQFFAAH